MLAKPTLVVSPWKEDGDGERKDQDGKTFSGSAIGARLQPGAKKEVSPIATEPVIVTHNGNARIASAIGILMFADECTTKQMRVSFARMLVEVDVTKTLPEEITFMDPNRKTIVHWVKHDLKPIFYQKY
ncbi:hypothetical protein KY285_001275 [Solanum tuberosum]|nr:hypothetical protein KY285_001275 [Solanum tuberosum]